MGPRIPDEQSVYFHCSTVFSGANAQIRKLKTITQLLSKHQKSIAVLTAQYPLGAIASVARQLLIEGIFESAPQAKARFPKLFPQSQPHQSRGQALGADVVRIKAGAAYETIPALDMEGRGSFQEAEHDEPHDHDGSVRWDSEEQRLNADNNSESAEPILKLCSTYLSFKTQHRILTFVQTILEECCLEFGKRWFPEKMEALKWNEAESIELTSWIKAFDKHVGRLPSRATRPVAGKSLNQVLSETSSLRHSAVHRIPRNVVEIMDMLQAASSFAKTLDDTVRAVQIQEIKEQMATIVDDFVGRQRIQHHKTFHQLEHVARRRTEIDDLERLGLEDLRKHDELLRIEADSAVQNIIAGLQHVPRPCNLVRTEKLETINAVQSPNTPWSPSSIPAPSFDFEDTWAALPLNLTDINILAPIVSVVLRTTTAFLDTARAVYVPWIAEDDAV